MYSTQFTSNNKIYNTVCYKFYIANGFSQNAFIVFCQTLGSVLTDGWNLPMNVFLTYMLVESFLYFKE